MAMQRRLTVLPCRSDGDDWMNRAVKVAFASTDLKQVNQHFGASEAFAIYAVDQTHTELVEVVQFGELAMDGNEDKLVAKISALQDCIAVYAQAVGASAMRQLTLNGNSDHLAKGLDRVIFPADRVRLGPARQQRRLQHLSSDQAPGVETVLWLDDDAIVPAPWNQTQACTAADLERWRLQPPVASSTGGAASGVYRRFYG